MKMGKAQTEGAVAGNRTLTRRGFLRLGGAGLAGTALLGATGCGSRGGDGDSTLTFSAPPDASGIVRKQVDRFNERGQGGFRVNLRMMPTEVDSHFSQLLTEFQAGGGSIDVMQAESAWPVQFAANGYIADISDRFTEDMRAEHLNAPVETSALEGKVYGIPFYTDAGMLYYRKDLLEENGIGEPPRTWAELKQMTGEVQDGSAGRKVFTFIGANYDGGVVNALEFIWNSGGDVLDPRDPTKVVIDSPEAVEGLQIERSMVTDGITPEAVVNYQVQEAYVPFLRGDAVFMRNWPFVYGLLSDPKQSKIKPEQVGVTVLPVASNEIRSSSGLGGWNLAINAASDRQDEAWEFVRYMADPERQKERALEGGYMPTLENLYDDRDVQEGVPVTRLAKQAFENARPRPKSPFYSDMSVAMAERFSASLNGDITPKQAVEEIEKALQEIIQQT